MELDLLKRHWEAFGRDDPLWAVLTEPDRIGGRWDLDEFLATGEREIAEVFEELAQLGIAVERGRALDFGCGVGRLTQALAARFERCDGVDIAASMIGEARRVNRHGDRVEYHVNDAPDLRLFGAEVFDFVLSFIVLQHMEPRYARRYIAEFIRILKPGGVAIFQLPSGLRPPAIAPLPDGAFKASLAVVGKSPRTVTALEEASVRVRVRNDSPHTWPAGSHIRLGNHWRDFRGRSVTESDGRTDINTELPPGAETTVDLTVRAPGLAGRHTLELDLVQEQVSWFASRGSATLKLTVEVRPTPSEHAAPSAVGDSPAGEPLLPVMEMYGIAPTDVRTIVADAGGEVLHQVADGRAGGATEGFHYVVRRVAEHTPPLPRASLSYLRDAIAAVPARPDMFPPVITRRSGRVGRLELRLREALGRITRPLTWVQADYDRFVLSALNEARAALEEQDLELRLLREEIARLKETGAQFPGSGE